MRKERERGTEIKRQKERERIRITEKEEKYEMRESSKIKR